MPNTEPDSKLGKSVHVAVGVVFNDSGQVLIALRNNKQHQGGLWEFPGGKVEPGETCKQALVRELNEELGISAQTFEPLIKICHNYSDKSVLLDVWSVKKFSGVAEGCEGQPLRWVDPVELSSYSFPAANAPIVKAVILPSMVAVTGEFGDEKNLLDLVSQAIDRGAGLLQFRPQMSEESSVQYLPALIELCSSGDVKLVLNSSVSYHGYSTKVGLHLTARDLMSLSRRPVADSVLLGASCHNSEQIQHAQMLGVDYIFLSPVHETSSHPNANSLGWEAFSALAESAKIPVYALGGVAPKDLATAKKYGAQGVAAIRAFWF